MQQKWLPDLKNTQVHEKQDTLETIKTWKMIPSFYFYESSGNLAIIPILTK